LKLIKFQTENYDCWTAKVGEVLINDTAIPVYEISVNPKDIESLLNYFEDGFKEEKYEQEFLDAFQKQFNEIHMEEPLFLIFILGEIDCYIFDKVFARDITPITGFLEVRMPHVEWGEWITWKESPAVADKLEIDEAFRTAFEKWVLAKYLQLLFGDKNLTFALPRYGSEKDSLLISERDFANGGINIGKIKGYIHWNKVAGLHHNLYAIWDEETGWRKQKLTEEDLELLHKDLTKNR